MEIHRNFYKPDGVVNFVGLGINSFIGALNETTVLKYPKTPGDELALRMLDLEARILKTIGPHKHIIGYKGQRKDGLLLERASCSLAQFLKDHTPIWKHKLAWARQATEAIIITHKLGVIYCDISINNLLLDNSLNIKLYNF